MRLQGAIAVYLLFGVGWAHGYAIVASIDPGSFTIPQHELRSVSAWFYYSFVTLTTVGFGDIVPAHPISRSLTVGEVLTGQLYLAILIGRLVGMQISSEISTTDHGST
jgi:voltage-gated potassium channel Kch